MVPLNFPLTFFAILLASAPAAAEWRAVDGDTLAWDAPGERQRWRLHGIDAPERRQACRDAEGLSWPCGRAAQDRLAALIAGRAVECQRHDTDRYGRLVGRCWAVDAASGARIDVQAALVREGLALAYLKYSWRYLPEQATAWWQRRGIWAGDFLAPELFRKKNRGG